MPHYCPSATEALLHLPFLKGTHASLLPFSNKGNVTPAVFKTDACPLLPFRKRGNAIPDVLNRIVP